MKRILFPCLLTLLFATHSHIMQAQETAAIKAIPATTLSSSDVIVVSFNATANKDRVLLNWTLDKNQAVDQIEIERSKDERSFVMAGLVFGTDQPDKVEYAFYEKNKGARFYYRLRIINKDRTVTYSPIVSPESVASSTNR